MLMLVLNISVELEDGKCVLNSEILALFVVISPHKNSNFNPFHKSTVKQIPCSHNEESIRC